MAALRRRWGVLVVLLGLLQLPLWWLLTFDPRARVPSAEPPSTVAIYDRNGSLLYEALDPDRGKSAYLPLPKVSRHLVAATIATEDASFYSNPGVDLLALLRAAGQNLRAGEVVSGGSTLTQQVARNLYMDPAERDEQSLWRKARELAIAFALAARSTKEEVLEAYLNSAPYGHQAVGVESAARTYFGKSARDLDLAESALLAGLPQAPSAYDPFVAPSAAAARRRTVLTLMARQGYVSEAEARSASEQPLSLASSAFPIKAPHFVSFVRQVASEYGLVKPASGDVKLRTTLDLGLQELAEATVRRHVAALAGKGVASGALVALDPRSGEILAMVGSADYFDTKIDGEVNVALAPRQPGSSIKPVLYAAALERVATPATVLFDVPTAFLTADGKSYAPENYDRAWHGPVSVREALANSYNLPAVSLLQKLGTSGFLDAADQAGLSSLRSASRGDLSLALGSGEVRLLDLTAAYAALASGGVRRPPWALSRVEDSTGRETWRMPSPEAARVFSPRVAFLVTNILSDNGARTPAFGPDSPLKLSRPAAAKTGTTTDWRDNWTVGYTPDLVVGVWVGNADGSPMRGISGISGAAPIWRDFTEEALKGRAPAEFARPGGLQSVEVCPESGHLPSPWCPSRRTELFADGTAPTRVCDWHRPVRIDRISGKLASPECPPELVEERVYEFLPPELMEWGRLRGVPEPPAEACDVHGGSAVVDSGVPRLVLVRPAQGTVLQMSRDIPADLQRAEVAVAASGFGSGARIELWVDGALVSTLGPASHRTMWPITAGRHTLEVVALDPSGTRLASTSVEVLVEGPP